MKQEQEETTIKEWFQRLKREDEQRAPSFTNSWSAAQARNSIARRALFQSWGWARWYLAAAAAILSVSGFIVYRTIQNDSPEPLVGLTKEAPAPRPSVTFEKHAATGPIKAGPRHGPRAQRPRLGNRPRLNTRSIRGAGGVAESMDNEDLTDFFPLRYGDDHKSMESGEVVRIQMPRSALISLGLPMNVGRADEPILADLLIGEDGLARAIRFVQ